MVSSHRVKCTHTNNTLIATAPIMSSTTTRNSHALFPSTATTTTLPYTTNQECVGILHIHNVTHPNNSSHTHLQIPNLHRLSKPPPMYNRWKHNNNNNNSILLDTFNNRRYNPQQLPSPCNRQHIIRRLPPILHNPCIPILGYPRYNRYQIISSNRFQHNNPHQT